VTRNSNRSRRWSLGPIEVYAYHDYSRHPWRSPLYIGGHLYRSRGFSIGSIEFMIGTDSILRPFSGGEDA